MFFLPSPRKRGEGRKTKPPLLARGERGFALTSVLLLITVHARALLTQHRLRQAVGPHPGLEAHVAGRHAADGHAVDGVHPRRQPRQRREDQLPTFHPERTTRRTLGGADL